MVVDRGIPHPVTRGLDQTNGRPNDFSLSKHRRGRPGRDGMKSESGIHRRRSIRLKRFDYSSAGAYFVTVCTHDRECLFGNVANEEMILNDAGQMILVQWFELPKRFANIALDRSVVMPNHVHGVIFIIANEYDKPVGAPLVGAQNGVDKTQRAGTRPAPTLGEIVGAFKSITTNRYIDGVKQHDWLPFPGKLWQRNYFERVIRDEDELNRTREYIQYNPVKWADDEDNPRNWK